MRPQYCEPCARWQNVRGDEARCTKCNSILANANDALARKLISVDECVAHGGKKPKPSRPKKVDVSPEPTEIDREESVTLGDE